LITVESNTKLDEDFDNFTRAIEKRREEEIRKIRGNLDELRAQASRLAETLTNSNSVW